jgi:hypothetical protein
MNTSTESYLRERVKELENQLTKERAGGDPRKREVQYEVCERSDGVYDDHVMSSDA